MGFVKGDRVRIGPNEGLVEAVYESEGTQYLAIIRPDGFRQIWVANGVVIAPPEKAEDPVRRKAVDLILDYKGVPRDHLFEYPYNAHESRIHIKEAEALLDDLLEVLEK